MMILISGGNGSGKSAFAECLAAKIDLPRYYIATMVCQSEENVQRIEKHRRQRAGLGFQTVEEPCRVSRTAVPADSLVLLEDVSNLLGNLIFREGGTAEAALQEILSLREACRVLVAVTISGLTEDGYDGETAAYIRDMNWLNEQLLAQADLAAELQNGQPVYRKGDWNGLV